MSNIRKKFIFFAMISVFVLLTALLGVLNGINFTLAAEDADRVTQMLSEGHGQFAGLPPQPAKQPLRPRGTDSPELRASVRHFTVSFNKDGDAKIVAFQMSAVTEEEAVRWAQSLKDEATGWTKTTYRYRVYKDGHKTFVTVIDQQRELISPYRILYSSIFGELAFLTVAFFILLVVSKRVLKPLEETDRKQERFLNEIRQDFRAPLNALNAGTEQLEKQHGADDVTRGMHREIRQMSALLDKMEARTAVENSDGATAEFDLSALCKKAAGAAAADLRTRSIAFSASIAPDVRVQGNKTQMQSVLEELFRNQLKFAVSTASLTLEKAQDRILLCAENDTTLTDRSSDQIFDRFVRLENADGIPGSGLGLAHVKDAVKSGNGRITAGVKDGVFSVRISL